MISPALTHHINHSITLCAVLAMGCFQSIISPSVSSTTLGEITCRSTYGPRQLSSIPTTTRAISFSTTYIERPLQYSTTCTYVYSTVSITDTYSESQTVVVTKAASQSDGIRTSTGVVYVSSTAYETVYETQQQTVTAPAATIPPVPYTVPTPPGFTPIASNPINAGANTYGGIISSIDVVSTTLTASTTSADVDSSTQTETASFTQADSTTSTDVDSSIQTDPTLITDVLSTTLTDSTTSTDSDRNTQTNPPTPPEEEEPDPAAATNLRLQKKLQLAAETHLHVRAEKSYSNVNRVICDATTTFITTSYRPFTVRHTMFTSTQTFFYWHYTDTILAQSFTSTTTQFSTAYEETTETISVTDTIMSQITETTTETPTQEATDIPRPTVYAVCSADNIIGQDPKLRHRASQRLFRRQNQYFRGSNSSQRPRRLLRSLPFVHRHGEIVRHVYLVAEQMLPYL
jgi:hypothetical protein